MRLQEGESAPIPAVILVVHKKRIKLSTMSTQATVSASATPPTLWQNSQGDDDSSEVGSEADAEKVMGAVTNDDDEEDTDTEEGLTVASTSANQNQGISNYMAEKYPFKERLAYFTPGNVLKPIYVKAVQAAIIFEAGHRVLELGTQKDPDLKDLYLKCFNEVLEEIDDSYMDSVAKDRLKILVGSRAANATNEMDGAKIHTRYNIIKRDINKHFIPKLPKNLSVLPSGTDLNEAFDNLKSELIKEFWKGKEDEPPDGWFLCGPVPVYLYLTVQIFRQSHVVNPCTANSPGNAKSKAVIKREKDAKRQVEYKEKLEVAKKKKMAEERNDNLRATSKALASKSYAQSIALKTREAQTHEIEKQLELLTKANF